MKKYVGLGLFQRPPRRFSEASNQSPQHWYGRNSRRPHKCFAAIGCFIEQTYEIEKAYTKDGNTRATTLPTLCEWIVKAWDELDVNTIVKSFKKCGISNRHDMLWDDVDPPAGDAMDIDSDVEDPYDEMVTPQDWLDLYGNSDDDDDEEFLGF